LSFAITIALGIISYDGTGNPMAVSAKLLKNRSGQRASNAIYPCLNGDKYLIYGSRNRQYWSDIKHIASGAPVGACSAYPAALAAIP